MEDGFLRKIRVAQFERGRTRVVLEVDDLSDYNAFLLPHPPRLIIDIHGKPEANSRTAQAAPAATSQLAKSGLMPAGSAKTDVEPELSAGVANNNGLKNNGVKKKIVEADSNDEAPMAEANPAETKRWARPRSLPPPSARRSGLPVAPVRPSPWRKATDP